MNFYNSIQLYGRANKSLYRLSIHLIQGHEAGNIVLKIPSIPKVLTVGPRHVVKPRNDIIYFIENINMH